MKNKIGGGEFLANTFMENGKIFFRDKKILPAEYIFYY